MLLFVALISCAICVHSLNIPVFVIAYNRAAALRRALISINALYRECQWNGDLHVLVDGPKDLNSDVAEAVSRFDWHHGNKELVIQKENIGLFAQRALAFRLEHKYWLVLEDDVEVSSLACHFINSSLSVIDNQDDIFGVSLTQPQWQIGVNENGGWRRLDQISQFNQEHTVLFPSVSTWAQLFKRSTWNNWTKFSSQRKASTIQGSIYEQWYHRRPQSVWSRDFQYFVYVSDLYNLHFTFPDDQALAVSHRAVGANTAFNRGPTGILLYDENLMPKKSYRTPKRFSYCFDSEDKGDIIPLNHHGISYELHRNHYCFMKMKRFVTLKVNMKPASASEQIHAINGLDYGGDTRLWTVKTLMRHGLYVVNEHLECVRMECAYKPGLYPHHLG